MIFRAGTVPCLLLCATEAVIFPDSVKRTFAIHPCSSVDRTWLRYLLMNAVAPRT